MQIIKTIAISQIGKIREHNEDALLSDDSAGLWLVADGMGGHASGEVASALAIKLITQSKNNGSDLIEGITTAHLAILEQGEQQPEQKGMGSTIVAVQRQKSAFIIAWVGDSRVYHFDKHLKQLTFDHTFVQDMVFRTVLTPDEAAIHPQRNLINRSLGMLNGVFKIDQELFKPTNSGFLLLCSDGVTDYLSVQTMEALFVKKSDLEELASNIEKAVMETEAGDNYSFILIEYEISLTGRWKNRLKI